MSITSRNNDSRPTLLRRHTARRRNAGLVTHGNEEVLAEALTITVRAQALTNTTSSAFLSSHPPSTRKKSSVLNETAGCSQ